MPPTKTAMSDIAFKWINVGGSNLLPWKIAQDQYKQMSALKVVVAAAEVGGKIIQTETQDLIFGEATVNGSAGPDYTDVAERVSVWSNATNVYVGVPAGDPVHSRAVELFQTFPALDNAFDLVGSKAITAFERALTESVF